MIIVTGVIDFETPEELKRVAVALNRRAAKSRADEGNIDYTFSISLDDPLQIRLIEKWESEDLLNAHLMVPDDEFNELIANAKTRSAVVEMHLVNESRELLRR